MKKQYIAVMTQFLRVVMAVFVVFSPLLLSSCSRKPDFIVEISGDTKGVKPGSPVTYRGAGAGRVTAVTPSNGNFRVEALLNDEYREQIRGAKARVVNGLTTQFNPQLCIIGSDDPKAPLLKRGQQVPEASVIDAALNGSRRVMSNWAIGAIALVFCIIAGGALLRGFVKIAIPVAGIALVAAWMITRQPENQAHVEGSTKDSIDDLVATARKVLETPENRALWQANEKDVRELLERAKGEGQKNLDSAKRQLSTSIDALERDANRVAVSELERLKGAIEKVGESRMPQSQDDQTKK